MRCNFMYNDKLKNAYDVSNDVLNELDIGEEILSVKEAIAIVSKKLNCEISWAEASFSNLSEEISEYGAMMKTEIDKNGNRTATIVLNSDNNAAFRRFSLFHELGHLMTQNPQTLFAENKPYVVSTHIDYKITSFTPSSYEENDFLFNEQQANVFALRVLMPWNTFKEKLIKLDSISKVAKYFGVTEDAVLSRIMLVR